MQRTLLIALAAAAVAAGVAAAATIVLTDNDEEIALASPSPSATVVATASVETPSPSATAAPTDDGSATNGPAPPRATARPTPPPGVTVRSAESVDCEKEPRFCSPMEEATLNDDRTVDSRSSGQPQLSQSQPTISLSSELRESNKSEAEANDAVSSIHVEVLVENNTKRTFVFAKREIVLDLFRDGKLFDSFSTTGDGFEMTPGSRMNGTFDRPITKGGSSYSWQAKIWYYEKE